LAREETGLAARYPICAFGFFIGMLALLGIPPLPGFAGRWRIYSTALQIHPVLLAGFVIASMFALIAYVSVFARVWWGPSQTESRISAAGETRSHQRPDKRESMLLRLVILLLVAGLLCAGLWPQFLVQAFSGGQS